MKDVVVKGHRESISVARADGCGAIPEAQWFVWRVLRRWLSQAAVALATLAISVGGVTAVQAADCPPNAPYPPAQCTPSVSTTTPFAGGPLTLSGTGFAPGTPVGIDLFSVVVHLATVTTDGSGNLTKTVTIPADTERGAHTIKLIGSDPGGAPRVLEVRISVVAPGPGGEEPGQGELPGTGVSGLALIGALGGILVGAGGLTWLLVQRRRRSNAS